MQNWKKFISTLVGVGVLMIEIAAPQIWPEAPQELWIFLFWLGVTLVCSGPIWWLLSREKSPSFICNWRFSFSASSLFPFSRLIKLGDASQKAFEELQDSLTAGLARRMSEEEDDVYSYFAGLLVLNDGCRVYGRRRPGTVYVAIPQELFDTGTFTHGGTEFSRHDGERFEYTDFSIRRSDFRERVKELREMG